MIRITVPGTTANIGPGFDSLGMALNLFLKIEVKKTTHKTTFLWNEGLVEVPLEKNLIYQTIEKILKEHDKKIFYSVKVIDNQIPISRGLGSSASAIVAAVYAANYLLDNYYSEEALLTLACDLEGHPDNVVPAIKGGFQISQKINGKYYVSMVPSPDTLDFLVMVPNFKVETKAAREILPNTYTPKATYGNIANTALLINALNQKKYSDLYLFLRDHIHQPYRIQLIHDGEEILKFSRDIGSLGEFISGSGPTLISIWQDATDIVEKFKLFNQQFDYHWQFINTTVNTAGTEIEVIHE